MGALDKKLVGWLEKVREELGGAPQGGEHPLEGCTLEGARIGKLLGVGSFAAVFELLGNGGDQNRLAVKVLERQQGTEQQDGDALFRREVDIGLRLDHPAITRIHRFVERPRTRFVILDRVEGQTWEGLLAGQLSPARYRELFAPLARGLSYAHEEGVVHRDLKPENVMLADDGSVKILDFGMARQAGSTEVTVTGQFKGTPMYCAPEQIIDSKKVGPACDQFSFGLLSYQALSGAFPYPLDPKAPMTTLFARLGPPAPPLSSAWPQAGAEADEAMARMLAKEPQDRFPSVQEAFAALSGALPEF